MVRIVISENVTLDGVIQDPTVEEGFKFGGWFDQMPDEVREEWANVESQDALDSQAWQIGRGSYLWIAERWALSPRVGGQISGAPPALDECSRKQPADPMKPYWRDGSGRADDPDKHGAQGCPWI